MPSDREIALRDMFTALTGGDDDSAREAISTIGTDPVERLLASAVLVDLSLPASESVALAQGAGSWAVPPLVTLLSGSAPRVLDGAAAAVLLGPGLPSGPASIQRGGTALILRQQAVEHLMAADFPGLPLTPVELRILFHLIVGLDLREMARIDRVGYETRRGQFKALAAKLGVPKQLDIVRMLLGRLLVLLGRPADTTTRHAAFFREAGDRRFGGGRPFVLQGPDGLELRAVEIGRGRGAPTIVLHPQAWPLMTAAEVAAVEDNGLRTLWPLRHGALAPGATLLPLEEQRARSLESIRALHELFCDGPVPLVGLISGAPFAIDAARTMPERFSSLTLVGACNGAGTAGNGAGALRRGIYWIARHNPGFLGIALRMMAAQISRPGAYVRAALHHYRDSPADLAVVTRMIRERLADRMQVRYTSSLASVRNDFLFQAAYDWSALSEVPLPVQLIHGEEDPVHPVEGIRALAAGLPQATVDVIPGAGQLLLFDHLVKVIGLLPGRERAAPAPASAMPLSRGTRDRGPARWAG